MRLIAILALLLTAPDFGESNSEILAKSPLIASGQISDRVLAQTSCYTNLTKIYLLEANVADASVPRTYTLCPNTVFNLAFVTKAALFEGGDIPISPRANAYYKCGVSGASSNNCTFTTGSVGLFHAGGYSEPLVNCTIQGITFSGLVSFGLVLRAGGQIAFVDCIVQGMSNYGPVNMDLSSVRRRLFQLPSLNSPTFSDRGLATVNLNTTLEISFDGCVFKDNRAFSVGNPGVITGTTAPGRSRIFLEVKNSLFTNNTYAAQTNGYAIQVDDSVTLKSNCFIDNKFITWGPVQVIFNASLTSSGNYGVSNGNVSCPYADKTDGSFSYIKCVPYEATSCAFSNPAIPPSSAPITTTTTAPSPVGASPSATSAPAAPTGATPTPAPMLATPSKPVAANGTQPTAKPVSVKSSAVTICRQASNVLAVSGIILCWLFF